VKTLHINTTEDTAQNILAFINNLVDDGKQVEILDDKIYNFEKKGIDQALLQEQNNETYSFEEVLQELQS
jgi:hypothetical protein